MKRRFGGAGGAVAAWVPAGLLLLGLAATAAVQPAGRQELRMPLRELPERLGAYEAVAERDLSEAELRVLAPDDYLIRSYRGPEGARMDLFAAFYGRQRSGATIHSPRNCLPGSGWEPVEHTLASVRTPYGPSRVNRYMVEHESGSRALVYYWYQGRGRVAASEYAVKWHLVRDALLVRRTDEALVRVVFPLGREGNVPDDTAREMVARVAEALAPHLPGEGDGVASAGRRGP